MDERNDEDNQDLKPEFNIAIEISKRNQAEMNIE